MSTALSKAEQNALTVSYDVLGTHVELDLDFVKRYLVRGRAELTTDQELVFFMNTCKMQNLNPLVSGEVYLIKYSKDDPAQMVVGKDAFLRRAYSDPNYLCKQDGITVQRGNQIVQKEGCCLYPGETLIGGWCRVTYMRASKERTAFREVALSEYNKGQANWKSKPSTMINKVAVSQCIRDAFPKDYEGVYSEEEMLASGAIPAVDVEYTDVQPSENVVMEDDPVITNEQRQELFRTAKKYLGDAANDVVKSIITELGFTSTTGLKTSDYVKAMSLLQEVIDNSTEQLGEEDTEPQE
jgi:phage recombination protein Bet